MFQPCKDFQHGLVHFQAHVAKLQVSELRQARQGRCQRGCRCLVCIDGQPGDVGEAAEQVIELRSGTPQACQAHCLYALCKEGWKPSGEVLDGHVLKLQAKVQLALLLMLPELTDRCFDAVPVRQRGLGQWVARTGCLGPTIDRVAHLLALAANACKPSGEFCWYVHGNAGCLGPLAQQQTL
ncbi:hypothetical protein D3C80_1326360 [compost metagenome]